MPSVALVIELSVPSVALVIELSVPSVALVIELSVPSVAPFDSENSASGVLRAQGRLVI